MFGKRHITSALLLLLALALHAADVKVKASLAPQSILIGQQTTLTLEIVAPKSLSIIMPEISARQLGDERIPTIAPGVEVLAIDTDTTNVDAETLRYERRYTLTSFDEGKTPIPSLTVKVGSKAYNTNAIDLSVAMVEVDTTNVDKFFPPKDVQNVPFQWSEWSPFFWLSVLIVALLLAAVYLFVRLKQNKPIISRIIIVRHIPAHQKALSAIDRIKEEPADTDQKAYYTALTDTLREYIRERFGFNAMEMTSAEIIDRLRQCGDETMIDELRDLFRTADLVKFAKHTTLIDEDDLNLVNAVNYIDQTKTDAQPTEERIQTELSKEDKRQQSNRLVAKTLLWIVALAAVLLALYVGANVF